MHSPFANELNKSKEFLSLKRSIETFNAPVGATGLSDVTKAFAIHSLCQDGEKAFIITPDEATAVKLQETLAELQDGVLLLPMRELTFVEVAGVSHEYEHIRLGVLSKILSKDFSAVIMSAAASMLYTMPPGELREKSFSIKVNDEINVTELEKKLEQNLSAELNRIRKELP